MTTAAPAPEILAARLAARILHDISGPASGVASGLDLFAEGGEEGGAGLELALASARSLLDMLEFHKAAFGTSGEALGGQRLRGLAQTPFEGRRPRLECPADIDPLPGPAAQAMLILAQIAAGALASGGVARATASQSHEETVLRIDGEGPRAGLPPETLEGLEGRPLSKGLAGRWAPARYLNALLAEAGGVLSATINAEQFTLTASFPAASMGSIPV
jgi:hypothetical protein